MEAALYTYGGGHMLYRIFNGMAAIVNTDDFWSTYVLIPAFIGLLWAGVLALSKADLKYFGVKWMAPALLFIEALIVPKTTLHIIDDVDPTFGYDKVDGLPQGLVAIISYSSMVSRSLTELMEDVYVTSDPGRMTKTGFAFSARLMKEARTTRIADPRVRENVKEWANQCIWLPYLKTNINGKRESVRNSDDLVSWVESNGHPGLGVYWKEADGTQTYKTCKAASPVIREAMQVETTKGISSLKSKLFGVAKNGDTARLKTLMQDTWQMVLNSNKSAHQQVQQMMTVNALKESLDDHRERANYSRIHPELVSMNATRALETQSMTGMMNAMISGTTMPLIQATLTALFSLVFILILPFFFLPGGMQRFLTWAKIIMSLQLWPVLSSILNAISILWYGNSTEPILDGYPGFSIASTTGLADAAWYVSSWAAGLQLMIPPLAWAILSGSQYALNTMVGGFTGSLERRAEGYATESVDGNVSMGNINMMNETLNSRSIAQQSHFANQNFAETLNTGSQTMTMAANGGVYSTQNTSQLASQFSSSDALSATASNQSRESEQLLDAHGRSFNESIRGSASDMLSLSDQRAKGALITNGLTKQESANFTNALDEYKSANDAFSKKHGISAQTAAQAALGFDSSKTLVGGAAERVFGMNAKTDINGQAINQESLDKAMNSEEGKRLQQSAQKVLNYTKQYGTQLTDSATRNAAHNINGGVENAKASAEAVNTSYTKSKNWDKVQSFASTKGFTVTSNENDAWLDYVSAQTGRPKGDAVEFLANPANTAEVNRLQSQFVGHQQEKLKSFVENADHVLSDREIQNWQAQTPVLNERGDEFHMPVRAEIAKQQFRSDEDLRGSAFKLGHEVDQNLIEADYRPEKAGAGIEQRNLVYKEEHAQEHEKMNYRRLVSKSIDDVSTHFSDSNEPSINDLLPQKR